MTQPRALSRETPGGPRSLDPTRATILRRVFCHGRVETCEAALMPRIRSVKPDFWTDEIIVQLPYEVRLFYIGMWNFADDAGCLPDEPGRLKMQILPNDTIDPVAVLDVLLRANRVQRHATEDGHTFLWIRRFPEHQKIDHPTASKWPTPTESSRILANGSESSRILAPDKEEDKEEEGKRRKKDLVATASRSQDPVWAVMVSIWGEPPKNKGLRTSWGIALQELRAQGFSVEEIRRRYGNAGPDRPWAVVTPMAFAKHCGILANPPKGPPSKVSRLLGLADDLERREHEAERSGAPSDEAGRVLPAGAS